MNLIVLMLDSIRQDHVSFYNQGNPVFDGIKACHTPNIDRFAEQSVVLDNMYPEGMPTIPSRAALITGNRSLHTRPWANLYPNDVTASMILTEEGYINGLITDTYHYRSPGMNYHLGYHSYQWVRGQEYDPWDSSPTERNLDDYTNEHFDDLWKARVEQFLTNTDTFKQSDDWFAPQVCDLTSTWLRKNRSHDKVFLWMDSFDPHEPWDPTEQFDTYTDPNYKGPRFVMPMGGIATDWATQEQIDHIRGLYAGEVAAVDHALGSVFETLEQEGYFDDSIVVLMGDHGHPLADQGKFLKGADRMYNELLKVPFMVRLPGAQHAGRHTTALTQFHDFLPTMLDLMGLQRNAHDMHGKSFKPVIEGTTDEHRETIIVGYHNSDLRCIRNKEWSLLVNPAIEQCQLFNLVSDPKEQHNVASQNPDLVASLRDQFGPVYFLMGRPRESMRHFEVHGGTTASLSMDPKFHDTSSFFPISKSTK